MSPRRPMLNELDHQTSALLHAYCDDRLTQSEADELSRRLLANPELHLTVAVLLRVHSELAWRRGGAASISSSDSTNAIVFGAVIEEDSEAQPARCLVSAPRDDERRKPFRLNPHLRRLAAFTAAAAAIAMFIWIGVKSLTPVPVATIAEEIGVSWDAAGAQPRSNGLTRGTYLLERGVVKLSFTDGTTTNFEAPCTFELLSPKDVRLKSGAIYTEVGGPEPDFTVTTPTAVIHDLGTAFGVVVYDDGSTDTAVMSGRVRLAAKQSSTMQAVEIAQGNRTRVGSQSGDIETVTPVSGDYEYRRYPLEVKRRVWLAAILCQPDNGRLEDCHCGLAFQSGEQIVGAPRGWGQAYLAPGGYLVTPQLSAIDGVFVPGSATPLIYDAQTAAAQPEDLTRRTTWEALWVGRPFHTDQQMEARYDALGIGPHAIQFHAPKGFTVDLQQVSAACDGMTVSRFRTALWARDGRAIETDAIPAEMDFQILIDGQVAYSALGMHSTDARRDIDVAIPAGAKSMTLVLTHGKNASDIEWVTMDQAVFELGGNTVAPISN